MVIKHDDSNNIYASRNVSDIDQNLPTAERDGLLIPDADETGYRIREQPCGTKRRLRVVLMGAGAATANFLKKAEETMSNLSITVYEKNHGVGGTWLENNYPGCACDIPSISYQYSWKPRIWSHYYSYSPEILQYLKDIYEENNFISRHVKLNHRVDRVQWNNEKAVWQFRILDLLKKETIEDEADIFINAGGVLNNWKWPDIPGLHDFSSKLLHSAAYDPGVILEDKRVAVIGAGSSGVQIVANIAPKVSKLYHWVRSPIWITAGFAQTWAGKNGANFAYSDEQKKYLEENPKKYLEYRKQVEDELNQRFKFIIKGSESATQAREFSYNEMSRKLAKKPDLIDKIIPKNFNPGCRRPTPAPGYLEALVADNTTVFTDAIGKITSEGFVDHEGQEHKVDVIICATGFDTSWRPRFPFVNGNGDDLRDLWAGKEGVTPYLSVGVPSFSNYFTFCGPYGPVGHGSFMPLIECWTKYILEVVEKMQIENIKSVTPRQDVSKQFRQHADLFLQRTAWTSSCRSWFKQGKIDGQAAIYPGSRLHFLHLMDKPRYEDYDIEYHDDNRFAFLGNGFDTRESDGRDITDYLGNLDEDGRDIQPEYGEELLNIMAGWAIGK